MIQACHLSIPATSDESHYAPRFQRRLNLTDPAYRIDPTASLHNPHLFPLSRKDANPLIESAGKTEASSLRAARSGAVPDSRATKLCGCYDSTWSFSTCTRMYGGERCCWSSVSSTASGSPRGADIESGSLLRQRRRRSYLRDQRTVGLLVAVRELWHTPSVIR